MSPVEVFLCALILTNLLYSVWRTEGAHIQIGELRKDLKATRELAVIVAQKCKEIRDYLVSIWSDGQKEKHRDAA